MDVYIYIYIHICYIYICKYIYYICIYIYIYIYYIYNGVITLPAALVSERNSVVVGSNPTQTNFL